MIKPLNDRVLIKMVEAEVEKDDSKNAELIQMPQKNKAESA